MNELRICTGCGALLPARTPEGLCPACLLETVAGIRADSSPRISTETAAPRRFGDYELLEPIGHGGMGVVYKARQLRLNRHVALKLLPFGEFTSDDFVKRFRAEAGSAARLQHPNIVAIHDVGECDGQPFFSMDYIEGQTLAEAVRDEAMPVARAVRLVRTIAGAVQYAHEQGVLQRDLKPANVLIDGLDQPHITDFGLAKTFQPEAAARNGSTQVTVSKSGTELTLSGHPLGSPNYMPPEQAEGKSRHVGPHSDVYALGAMLYHLLAGRPPFAGETMTAVLQQVVHDEPVSPRLLNPSISRDLETICLKCLQKDPNRRYSSARELADELARIQNDEPIRARPVGPAEKLWRWCRRRPALAGAMATAVLLLAGGLLATSWQWRRAERHARAVEAALVQADLRRADEFLLSDQSGPALAWLAHVLRRHPENHVAGERMIWALSYRDFSLPLTFAMRHDDRIESVRFNPAGTRVLTASIDGTARLWDAATGQPVGEIMRHSNAARTASWSSSGKRILTRCDDSTVRVWSGEDGSSLGPPVRHTSTLTAAEFLPNGERFVTASMDSTARIWSGFSGEPAATLLKHGDAVLAAALSSDGRFIATACHDRAVYFWDAMTGEASGKPILRDRSPAPLLRITPDTRLLLLTDGLYRVLVYDLKTSQPVGSPAAHQLRIMDLRLNQSGSRFITASADGTARVWDTASGQPITPPLAHSGPVMSATFSPDGGRVATASADGTARIWNAVTGAPFSEPMRHASAVVDIDFHPGGQELVTASWDGTARLWDIRPASISPTMLDHASIVRHIAFSADGQRVLTASEDYSARVWEVSTGRPRGTPMLHEKRIVMAAFSPDGQRVATASWDNTARVWDARTGTPVTGGLPHSNYVLFVQFSPDSRRLLTCARDGQVRLWDAETGNLEKDFVGHSAAAQYGQFSSDGHGILTASRDGSARLWNIKTGMEVFALRHDNQVTCARFDAGNARIVTAAEDWTARVWDAQTGRPLTPPLRHLNNIQYAEFSPDGRLVVTASVDGTGRLWDARNGVSLPVTFQHADELRIARFSPDGARVVTSSEDGTARIWDVRTGRALSEPLRHRGVVGFAEFSPDGRQIATASDDGRGRLWVCPQVPAPAPEWLASLAEAVGGLRVDDSGALNHVSADELVRFRRRPSTDSPDGPYVRWRAWFFADRESRPKSPWRSGSAK